jgi:hypothetical protein
MPLRGERCWLESEVAKPSMQIVLGGVVSHLVVRSYGVMAVVAPFLYLAATCLSTITLNTQQRRTNDIPCDFRTGVCRPTFWLSRSARRGAILTGKGRVGRGIILPPGFERRRWRSHRCNPTTEEQWVGANVPSGVFASVGLSFLRET